jgi:hypothetical protein
LYVGVELSDIEKSAVPDLPFCLGELSYEVPYLGPDGSRPGRPTQAVNSIIMSGIAPKHNAFKFKIAPHKQKSIVKKN